MANDEQISAYLQEQLRARGLTEVAAVDAARWLEDAGLLANAADRPGRPLRSLLRAGRVRPAEQRPPAPNGRWYILRRREAARARERPSVDEVLERFRALATS